MGISVSTTRKRTSALLENVLGQVYLKGKESVDGSLRIISLLEEVVPEIQLRQNGVWNGAEIVLSNFTISDEGELIFDDEGSLVLGDYL